MGKCQNCNIEILDESEYCPLCRSVLAPTDELENMYPNARVAMRRRMFFCRIYLFCGIIAEAILIFINLLTDSQVLWSIISGLGILYSYMLIRYAIIGKSGYRSKVTVLSLIGILSAIAIDFVIGYRGWSIDYVLPAGIMLVDVIILWCMVYNHRNWQSYIMWQIAMILCSLIPILLYVFKLENNAILAFLPLAISVVIFIGTVIIGDRRAIVELQRRFHIN